MISTWFQGPQFKILVPLERGDPALIDRSREKFEFRKKFICLKVVVAPFILRKSYQILNFSRFIPPVKKVSYFFVRDVINLER